MDDTLPVQIVNSFGEGARTGTRLVVAGVEIPEMTEVSLRHRAGQVAFVHAEIATLHGFDVRLHAAVSVLFVGYPGTAVRITPQDDGSTVYSFDEQ